MKRYGGMTNTRIQILLLALLVAGLLLGTNMAPRWSLNRRLLALTAASAEATGPCHPPLERRLLLWREYVALRQSPTGDPLHALSPAGHILAQMSAAQASSERQVDSQLAVYFSALAWACDSVPESERQRRAQLAARFAPSAEDPDLLAQEALYLYRQQRWQEALPLYATLSASADAAGPILVQTAVVYRSLGDYEASLDVLARALARGDSNPAQVLTLMGHSTMRVGDVERALALLAEAEAALVTQQGAAYDGAQTYYFKGLALEQADRPVEAEAAYLQAIAIRPGFDGVLLRLARYALARGETAQAQAYLQRISSVALQTRLGLCLQREASAQLGDRAAVEVLDRSLAAQNLRCNDVSGPADESGSS